MKHVLVGSFALALVAGALLSGPSTASAQVIIQGEVSVYAQPQPQPYAQPQPQPYAQPYGQPQYASPYVAQQAAPQGRMVHRTDSLRALWVPGILAFAGGFIFSLLADLALVQECPTYLGGCPDETWQALEWIPLVGPWLSLGIANPGEYAWVNYVGGILQTAGLVAFVLGLAITEEWDEPVYSFNADDPLAPTLAFDGGPTGGTVTLSF